jgi:hypothetical protein
MIRRPLSAGHPVRVFGAFRLCREPGLIRVSVKANWFRLYFAASCCASSSAFNLTLPPIDLIFLSQILYPFFVTVTV